MVRFKKNVCSTPFVGVLELGAVPHRVRLPVPAGGAPDAVAVLGTPSGTVPERGAAQPPGGDHERHGGAVAGPPARPVRQPVRAGRVAVRADDGRQLVLHRAAGHRARHHHHAGQRRTQVPEPRAAPRHRLRHLRPRRHERRPGQGRRHRRLRRRRRRN